MERLYQVLPYFLQLFFTYLIPPKNCLIPQNSNASLEAQLI